MIIDLIPHMIESKEDIPEASFSPTAFNAICSARVRGALCLVVLPVALFFRLDFRREVEDDASLDDQSQGNEKPQLSIPIVELCEKIRRRWADSQMSKAGIRKITISGAVCSNRVLLRTGIDHAGKLM